MSNTVSVEVTKAEPLVLHGITITHPAPRHFRNRSYHKGRTCRVLCSDRVLDVAADRAASAKSPALPVGSR